MLQLHGDCGSHLIQATISFIFFEWVSRYVSTSFLKQWSATKNFNSMQKAEFQSRTISVWHAIIASFLSLYAFFADEESNNDMIWGDSWIIRSLMAISVGYFVSDLMIMSKDVQNVGGGWGYVWHHLSALWPYLLVITVGCLPYFANFRIMAEISTPFVNARWYYSVTGRKDTNMYFYNGLMILATFFLSRIVALPYYYYLVYTVWNTEAFERLGLVLQVSWLLPCIILDVLNVYWFCKLVKGALKVLERRKSLHAQKKDEAANEHVKACEHPATNQSAAAENATAIRRRGASAQAPKRNGTTNGRVTTTGSAATHQSATPNEEGGPTPLKDKSVPDVNQNHAANGHRTDYGSATKTDMMTNKNAPPDISSSNGPKAE